MNDLTVGFATNRDPIRKRKKLPIDFGKGFNTPMDELRFGEVHLDLAGKVPGDFADAVELEAYATANLEVRAYDERADRTVLGSQTLFDRLKVLMDQKTDVLVYMHGYNVTFRQGVATGAALQWLLSGPPTAAPPAMQVATFSWPSDGKLTPYVAYRADRLDAKTSGPAFGRAFLKLYEYLRRIRPDDRCGGKMHLLCHSMGNYVLENAIQHLEEFVPGRLPRVFDEIVLVAADVDADALEDRKKLGRLAELGTRITVYINHADKALLASDWTKGNPERLGQNGPSNLSNVPDKVDVVDTTPVVHDFKGHSYFLNGVVADDLREVLGAKAPTRRVRDERRQRWRLS
ncbi:MAG: alpha/beta hydrolase [Myxococcota bacterium]